MIRSGLILAAHGSRDTPFADAAIYDHAVVLSSPTPDRFVLYDTPIGTDPGIVQIVADLAQPVGTPALGEVA